MWNLQLFFVFSPAVFQLEPDYYHNKKTGDLPTDLCNDLNYVFMTWMGKKIGGLRHCPAPVQHPPLPHKLGSYRQSLISVYQINLSEHTFLEG